jgi:hypothetical protein
LCVVVVVFVVVMLSFLTLSQLRSSSVCRPRRLESSGQGGIGRAAPLRSCSGHPWQNRGGARHPGEKSKIIDESSEKSGTVGKSDAKSGTRELF